MTKLIPTDEQAEALRLYAAGESFLIAALAGTGKSETLMMMARSDPSRRVRISAFNKAIVVDLDRRVSGNARANTLHSIANTATSRRFAHRFDGQRVKSSEYARILHAQPIFVSTMVGRKVLQKDFVASLAVQTVKHWCQSADPAPLAGHVPFVEGIALEGDHWANQDRVREEVLPLARTVAKHVLDPTSDFPCTTDLGFAGCIKAFEMFGAGDAANPQVPYIDCDVLMIDEGQDLSHAMRSIVERQTHCQRVVVGDQNQRVFEFLNLDDLFERFSEWPSTPLTTSWRFGPRIAELANDLLGRLRTELRLVGGGPVHSHLAKLDAPSAVMCRTNAQAIREVLVAQRDGHTTHLVGNGEEVANFARGAQTLMEDGWTWHSDLKPFGSWGEVVGYVQADPAGGELALLVRLVEEFTIPVILAALDSTIPMASAETVVSTTHKSKGLGFESVKVAEDFGDDCLDEPVETRLLYVAATRAQEALDISECPPLMRLNGRKPWLPEGVDVPSAQVLAPSDGPQLSLSDIF